MVESPNECDLRYLELYEEDDNKRAHKLKVNKGDGLLERSVTQMKKNFSEFILRKSSFPKSSPN
jgi:hypothetical protein